MKKPAAIKKQQGTFHTTKDKNFIDPVNLIGNKPAYPKRLNEVGRHEWDVCWSFLLAHDMCDTADLSSLETYCYSRQIAVLYSEIVEKDGPVQCNPTTGYLSAHPLIQAADRAVKTAEQISKMFGFSPSARASLGVVKPKKQESKMAILKGRINKEKVIEHDFNKTQ